MVRCLLFLFSLITFLPAEAQRVISGSVRDLSRNSAIANASVFLNNTSIGTKTNAEGKYELSVPEGKFELIVSSVGYETFSRILQQEKNGETLDIKLRIKAVELETVFIEPFEKDGWDKWGTFFLDHFIGTSDLAFDCKILNYEKLRFRNSKKTGELTVIALEPLVIENKALGYRLHYQLESFVYHFSSRNLLYTGYPFFEPMKGTMAKQRRWNRNRKDAYYGSLLHFMRSVYRNKIMEEGFEVRRLVKLPNLQKQRVKAAYNSNMQTVVTPDGKKIVTHINKDTAEYFGRIMKQDDFIEVYGRDKLPGDSIAFALSQTVAGLEFPDYLLVIYKNKPARAEYIKRFPKSSAAIMSQLTLVNGTGVEIQANGSYYQPQDLMSLGYWAWSEKIASMLPFDYEPMD